MTVSLITGAPIGNITQAEDIYLESAPQIYMQDYRGAYAKNPDSDGFYWSLTGTATYPIYAIGCYTNFSMGDNLTTNAVRCDTVGDRDVIMKRNHIEMKFTLTSFLPFTMLSALMNGGTVTTNLTEQSQKFGLGLINNNQYWRFYLPKVYDEVDGDYVAFTIHRAKIMSTGEISMSFGNQWQLPITVWALADDTLPSAQKFVTAIRVDASAL